MNNFFKRAACLAVTAVMTLSSTGALACTGYYVGKQASASGHTIIGHTVDAWNTAQAAHRSLRDRRPPEPLALLALRVPSATTPMLWKAERPPI